MIEVKILILKLNILTYQLCDVFRIFENKFKIVDLEVIMQY
jgi:hypothetical protein